MISSHVLDLALGVPARGVTIHLEVLEPQGGWRHVASATTNDDGRAPGLADAGAVADRTCRLSFDTAAYFAAGGRATFFPRIEILFSVPKEGGKVHVPLLVSPFGYSVYRGS